MGLIRGALAGAALAVGMASAALAQTPPAGRATLLAYPGVFRDNYSQVVVEPFQRRAGIQVQYTEAGNGTSAQMLGAIRAQRADPQVDVVIMDVTTAALACAEGLVEKLTPAELPVLSEIDGLARSAGGECGPGVTYDHLVIVYDTRAVNPAPAGLASLAAPEARGRVGLNSPPNILGLGMAAAIAHKAAGDWRNLNAALTTLRGIAANTQTFDPNPDGYTMVLNEQLRYAIGWNARAQFYRDQSQGRLGVVLPEEGAVFQINTINLVANAKNRTQGLAFIAHALSAPAQAAFTERMFYAPTNTQAQVAPEALNRTAAAPHYRSRVVPIDWNEMVRLRDSWNQRWRRDVVTAAPR